VASVHQSFKALRSAVGILHSEGINAIITPVAVSRELGNGHKFYGSNAQFLEFVEVDDNSIESAFGAKGSHMKFINNELLKRQTGPVPIPPCEIRVHHLRRTLDTLGLGSGRRVRALFLAIQPV
jgi:hypothetical protein